MTTIIVVAIVALVFFVTVCVVAFMVWKREAEMRTDSIRAIERSMNDMAHEIAGLNVDKAQQSPRYYDSAYSDIYDKGTVRTYAVETKKAGSKSRAKKKDPFSWTRRNKNTEIAEDETMTVFKPMEGENRKLKWTEVSEERISKGDEPKDIPAAEEQQATATAEENPQTSNSINLSFVDLEELELGNLEDIEFFESLSRLNTAYNMGRSGRKYTAEELEELIKE